MTTTIRKDSRRPAVSRRWLPAVYLLIVLPALACTGPAGPESEARQSARLLEPAEPGPVAAGSEPIRQGHGLVDSEELIGLGELGLLPSLLQGLGTGFECDFDDAFSTCQ